MMGAFFILAPNLTKGLWQIHASRVSGLWECRSHGTYIK